MKIIVLFLLALLMSCSKTSDFAKVKKGMTSKQVFELVGDPIDKQEIPFPLMAKFLIYETHVVVIVNDTVTRCETKKEFAEGFKKNLGNLSEDLNNINQSIQEYKAAK